MLSVEQIKNNKGSFTRRILEALPDWFGIPDAVEDFVRTAEELTVFGCYEQGAPAGVISIKRHFPQTHEVHVLAVKRHLHGQGLGRALIECSAQWSKKQGASLLTVKTLGPSHSDPNYAGTRLFFEALRFMPLEEFKTLWQSGEPCLIMARVL